MTPGPGHRLGGGLALRAADRLHDGDDGPGHDGGQESEDREVCGDGGEDTDQERAEVHAGGDRPGADAGAECEALDGAVGRGVVDVLNDLLRRLRGGQRVRVGVGVGAVRELDDGERPGAGRLGSMPELLEVRRGCWCC